MTSSLLVYQPSCRSNHLTIVGRQKGDQRSKHNMHNVLKLNTTTVRSPVNKTYNNHCQLL